MTQIAVIHTAFEDTPRTVALVDAPEGSVTEQLEYAYRWTQNIMDSWSMKGAADGNDRVTLMQPLHVDESGKEWGHRSTSMGDQMLLGTTKYKVAAVGFEEI
jgi:hypothetical protein